MQGGGDRPPRYNWLTRDLWEVSWGSEGGGNIRRGGFLPSKESIGWWPTNYKVISPYF